MLVSAIGKLNAANKKQTKAAKNTFIGDKNLNQDKTKTLGKYPCTNKAKTIQHKSHKLNFLA